MRGEQAFNITVFIVACFLFINSWTILKGIGQGMSPNIWPAILLGGIVILSGILIVKYWKNQHKVGSKIFKKISEEEINSKRLFFSLLLIIIYFSLFPYLGFIIASIFFLVGYMYLMGLQKKLIIYGASIFIVFIIVLLFNKILLIPLPRGFSIFRDISLIFY